MSEPENQLRTAELVAADAIGDVIEHWGFRKALGRVWTVLYLEEGALSAAELGERLSMSAGAVSMAVGELARWGVIKRVWRPGERRDFFEAETDFWKMISKVVSERERFLAESVKTRLDDAAAMMRAVPSTREVRHALERLKRLQSFAAVAQTVLDSFIASRRADFKEFGNLLSIGRSKA